MTSVTACPERTEWVRTWLVNINNIMLIDFYSKTVHNIEYYSNDSVHFDCAGVHLEAELMTQKILEILKLKSGRKINQGIFIYILTVLKCKQTEEIF